MKTKNISHNDYKVFSYFALFFVLFGIINFLAALLRIFYEKLIFANLVISIISFLTFLFHTKIIKNISREFTLLASISVFVAIFFTYSTAPSVFTGRDQGSLSTAAILLADHNSLSSSSPVIKTFFDIYGQGKALNFPGFFYTQSGALSTQFPVPYISWLAAFYTLFDLNGFIIANCILLCVFFISFYLLFCLFSKDIFSRISFFLLVITSFPFFYFSRFTLSENLALPLIVTMFLFLILSIQKNQKRDFILFLLFGFFLIFTRIEGIVFFILSIIALLFFSQKESVLLKNWRLLFVSLFVAIFTFGFSFTTNMPFYKTLLKALLYNQGSPDSTALTSGIFDRLSIFYLYGLLGFFIIGFFGILYFFYKKQYTTLLPFLVSFPVFIYFINPSISSDHPWMLRRFMFTLLPVVIFYTVLFLSDTLLKQSNNNSLSILKKIIYGFIMTLLLFFNFIPASYYFYKSENEGLLKQVQDLSTQFSDHDLILIDREASGDGWHMIAGPLQTLYNKNAVYFFNPKDLVKIDRSLYNKVYLIVPEKNYSFYKDTDLYLEPVRNYSLVTPRFDLSEKSISTFPVYKTITISGIIFEIKSRSL